MSKFLRVLCCFVFVWGVALTATAQESTASLFGNVTDASGAAVPNAEIVITQTATGYTRTIHAEGNGSYRADFLPIGPYKVAVSAPGFKTLNREGIVLTVTEDAQLPLQLQAGGAQETVDVTADVPLVNTGNSTLGRTVTNVEIDNLPLVDRNAYQLLDLTPGVQNNNAAGSGGNGGVINPLGYPEQHVKINGSSDSGVGQVAYYLDGGSNMTGVRNTGNPLPNPDALQEFRVDTNNYSAQYGRNSSGVVTVLTKSGSNAFHGSVFEFYRDRNLNATEHLQSVRTPYNQHRFGFTVGGPVIKDKLFFFGSYAGFRFISDNTFVTTVPTAAMDNGDFSLLTPGGAGAQPTSTSCTAAETSSTSFWLCNAFVTSHTGQMPLSYQGVYNKVDPSQLSTVFDPSIMAIIKAGLIPTPNPTQAADTQYTRRDLSPFRQKTNEELYKADYDMTQRQRLTFSYFHMTGDYVNNPSGNNILGWVTQDYVFAQHEANIIHTWTVSNATVNQLNLNYTRLIGGRVPSPAQSLADFGSAFTEQIPNGSICGVPAQLGCSRPQMNPSGWFTAGNAITGPVTGSNVYAIRDLVSSTHGKHTLYYGGEANRENDAQQTTLDDYGVFSFTNHTNTANHSAAAISDFFFGSPNTMEQDVPVYANANYFNYGLFAQDDWRILANLTLNLGVRYDIQTAPTNTQNMLMQFVPGAQSTVAPTLPKGILLPGDSGVPRGGVDNRYDHVSPRVGLAWQPFGNGRTVVHAGAGLFYGSVGGNLWGYASNGEPFSGRPTFSKVIHVDNPYATDPAEFCNGNAACIAGGVGHSPFPFVYNPSNPQFVVTPAALITISPNFHWPVAYQMNAGFQQQLTSSFAFGASYVASLNRKLPTEWDINYPLYNLNAAGAPGIAPGCTTAQACGYTSTTNSNVDNRRPYNDVSYAATPTTNAANPFYKAIDQIQSSESANYNALQVTFQQRMQHGLSVQGFYTWSKTLDSLNLDQTGNTGNTAVDEPEDNRNHWLDRQRSDYDQRHVFAAAAIWKPHFATTHHWLNYVENGWTLTSIIQLQSGDPFNITTGSDDNEDGVTNDRPDLAPGVVRPRVKDNGGSRVAMMKEWVDINQFCRPFAAITSSNKTDTIPACPQDGAGPAGSDGTVRQDTLDGPGRRAIAASLFKDIHFTDRVFLQLRAEATNVFNLTNLPNPTGTISSGVAANPLDPTATGSFGQINGTITAGTFSNRVLQVGGRILF